MKRNSLQMQDVVVGSLEEDRKPPAVPCPPAAVTSDGGLFPSSHRQRTTTCCMEVIDLTESAVVVTTDGNSNDDLHEFLQQHGDVARIKAWLNEHAGLFCQPVLGPVGIMVKAKSPLVAAMLEDYVPGEAWRYFIVQTNHDAELLCQKVQQDLGLTVSIYNTDAPFSLKYPFSLDTVSTVKERCRGVQGLLDECIECHGAVRQFLQDIGAIHHVLVANRLTFTDLLSLLPQLNGHDKFTIAAGLDGSLCRITPMAGHSFTTDKYLTAAKFLTIITDNQDDDEDDPQDAESKDEMVTPRAAKKPRLEEPDKDAAAASQEDDDDDDDEIQVLSSQQASMEISNHQRQCRERWFQRFPSHWNVEHWVAEQAFQGRVEGPVGALVTPKNKFEAALLERYAMQWMWSKYIVELQADEQLFKDKYIDDQVAFLDVEPAVVHRLFTEAQMQVLKRNYGVKGYLDQVVSLPSNVRRFLVKMCPEMAKVMVGAPLPEEDRQGLWEWLADKDVKDCTIVMATSTRDKMTALEISFSTDNRAEVEELDILEPRILWQSAAEHAPATTTSLPPVPSDEPTPSTLDKGGMVNHSQCMEEDDDDDDAADDDDDDDDEDDNNNNSKASSDDDSVKSDDAVVDVQGTTDPLPDTPKYPRKCSEPEDDADYFDDDDGEDVDDEAMDDAVDDDVSTTKRVRVLSMDGSDSGALDMDERMDTAPTPCEKGKEQDPDGYAGATKNPPAEITPNLKAVAATPMDSSGSLQLPPQYFPAQTAATQTAGSAIANTQDQPPLATTLVVPTSLFSGKEEQVSGNSDQNEETAMMDETEREHATRFAQATWRDPFQYFQFLSPTTPAQCRRESEEVFEDPVESGPEDAQPIPPVFGTTRNGRWNSLLEIANAAGTEATGSNEANEEEDDDGENEPEGERGSEDASVNGGDSSSEEGDDDDDDSDDDDTESIYEEAMDDDRGYPWYFGVFLRFLLVIFLLAASGVIAWYGQIAAVNAWESYHRNTEIKATERVLDFMSLEAESVAKVVGEIGFVLEESDKLTNRLANIRHELDGTLLNIAETKEPFEDLLSNVHLWDGTVVDLRHAVSVYVASLYLERLTLLTEKGQASIEKDSLGLPLMSKAQDLVDEWKRQEEEIAENISELELTRRQLSKEAAFVKKERSSYFLWG